jgi:hypothetical protein
MLVHVTFSFSSPTPPITENIWAGNPEEAGSAPPGSVPVTIDNMLRRSVSIETDSAGSVLAGRKPAAQAGVIVAISGRHAE